MNLRSVDLNLLVVLDALLDEAHVSRAAVRLNLSQPAVSNALQRCRDLFGDPLLERGRGTMSRTPKAEAMRAHLKSILAELVVLIDPPSLELRNLHRTLRITLADDPAAILVGPLMAELKESAPGLTIVIRPWKGAAAAVRDLLDGDTELAVSVFDRVPEDIETSILIKEDYVVAMRRDHPATDAFDLDTWLDWPHVLVSGQGERVSPLDRRLHAIGRKRWVGITVPSFHLVPAVLQASDHMAMVPRRSLELHDCECIVSFPPPIEVAGFPLHLGWHNRNTKDPAVRHIATTIEKIFEDSTIPTSRGKDEPM